MANTEPQAFSDGAGSAVDEENKPEVVYYVTMGYRLCNVLIFVGMLAASACTVFGWFPGGLTVQTFNEKYETVLTPDIWTYYIWLLIFALQAIAMVDLFFFTKFRKQTGKKGRVLHAIDHYWILGFICIGCWIVASTYETGVGFYVFFGFSVGALASFLLSLLRLHGFKGWFNLWYYILYLFSAGLASGWLCVEVAMSTLIVLKQYDISTTLQEIIGFAVLSLATAAGLTMLFMLREFAFNLALIWGLLGILVRHVVDDTDSNESTNGNSVGVIASVILAGVLLISCIVRLVLVFFWDLPKARKRKRDYQDVASSAGAAEDAEAGRDDTASVSSSRPSYGKYGAFSKSQFGTG